MFWLSMFCLYQHFQVHQTAPPLGTLHLRGAPGGSRGAPAVLLLTLMGARPILSQAFCFLNRALCECSVNGSIKYSLWKESKSPSTEQTHIMKWAFLACENPCLTLSKIIAWLSKKKKLKNISSATGKSEQASFCEDEPRATVDS